MTDRSGIDTVAFAVWKTVWDLVVETDHSGTAHTLRFPIKRLPTENYGCIDDGLAKDRPDLAELLDRPMAGESLSRDRWV